MERDLPSSTCVAKNTWTGAWKSLACYRQQKKENCASEYSSMLAFAYPPRAKQIAKSEF